MSTSLPHPFAPPKASRLCQYLRLQESHVVAEDVEPLRAPRGEALHEPCQEVAWVEELVATPNGEGEGEVVRLTKAEEDIHDGAAGALVDFQENNVSLGLTRLPLRGDPSGLLVFFKCHLLNLRDFCPAWEKSPLQVCLVKVLCLRRLS